MKRRLVRSITIVSFALALVCGIASPERWSSPAESLRRKPPAREVSFEDKTRELIQQAERLIEKNSREGSVLDQRWYAFRRFGHDQGIILGAERVLFYGGLEVDVQDHVRDKYTAVTPLAPDSDPGEMRLFVGHLPGGRWDCIVVGQNGREIALKAVIRLLYMTRFNDEPDGLGGTKSRLFRESVKVYMSAVSPRAEYLAFFKRHGIRNPDMVVIGFMGDASVVLNDLGFPRPEPFSDESLRVLWYPNVNGKKVLLISINGNRIFASRSRDLMDAIYDSSPDSRPVVTFVGSAGAVDRPELIGRLVAPTAIMNGDPFPETQASRRLMHVIRNHAVRLVERRSVHTTIESVVVETTEWAKRFKSRGVGTVDQELYHVVDAIHTSRRGPETDFYAAVLVTDHVATNRSNTGVTLESAEKTISATATLRQEFFLRLFSAHGLRSRQTLSKSAKHFQPSRIGIAHREPAVEAKFAA